MALRRLAQFTPSPSNDVTHNGAQIEQLRMIREYLDAERAKDLGLGECALHARRRSRHPQDLKMPTLKGRKSPPKRLPDGFTVTKPEGVHTHVAVCETWTNPDGWELRLTTDGQAVPIATIVRSADEMRTLIETWRTALLETGWS